jgi:hypothetical protein
VVKASQELDMQVMNFILNYLVKEIKLKIARIATPILINRCKQTLKKFIKDEKKVGSVGMSKSRISEVVFILDKLSELDCYPQT